MSTPMISSTFPVAPIITGTQFQPLATHNSGDPLQLLTPDAISRAREPGQLQGVTAPDLGTQVLAGSVVLSSAGAAALVAYIVHEHVRAKRRAARGPARPQAPCASARCGSVH